MAYNEITNRSSPNYWAGGNTIKGITIHWWGDPATNPTAEGVVNWLCNPASQVSAHFVITGTGRRVWQLVNDRDRAWHALAGNQSTLGLELDPRCRDEDYDVAAEVIADLWRYYGKLPLYPHKHFVATACPGNYDLGRLQRLAEQKLNPPKPAPTNPTKPVPAAEKLPKPLDFKAKLDKTHVWDLTTNPNYKAATTLKKGAGFRAYAQIKFNGAVYYVTEYSFNKGLKNGVNAVDLEAAIPETPAPKPTPAPTPAPEPAPEKPVVEKPDYAEENNTMLKQILELLNILVNKINGIFK